MPTKPIKVWSLPVRLIHWTLVCSFIGAWIYSGSIFSFMNHVYFGLAAGAAIVSKWIYGSLCRDFSGFTRFPPRPLAAGGYLGDLARGKAKRYLGHNPAGAIAIYLLLTSGTITILTGIIAFEQIEIFMTYEGWQEVHSTLAHLWLYVVVIHVSGVILGSISHKENLILAMITGYKKRRLVCTDKFYRRDNDIIPEVSGTLRLRYIEEAAYYLAERRGFAAGYDKQDWLDAEKQVDAMLAEQHK